MYKSGCRNCKCFHYYGTKAKHYDYPTVCYCVIKFGDTRCLGYLPKDNIEYIEWMASKELKSANE